MINKLAMLIGLLIVTVDLMAQPCAALGEKQPSQLESFVRQWYRLPSGQTFTLVDNGTVDSAC